VSERVRKEWRKRLLVADEVCGVVEREVILRRAGQEALQFFHVERAGRRHSAFRNLNPVKKNSIQHFISAVAIQFLDDSINRFDTAIYLLIILDIVEIVVGIVGVRQDLDKTRSENLHY